MMTIKEAKAYVAKHAPRHNVVWKRERTCAWGLNWHGWCQDCQGYFVICKGDIYPLRGTLVAKAAWDRPILKTTCYGADSRDKLQRERKRQRNFLLRKYAAGGIDAVIAACLR